MTARVPLTVSEAPVPFGVSAYEMRPEEVGGGVDTQAGSHPFQFTTTIDFNEGAEAFEGVPLDGNALASRPMAPQKDPSLPAAGFDRQPDAGPAVHAGAVHHRKRA